MHTAHLLLSALLLIAVEARPQTINNTKKTETMSTSQENEAIVRSLYEDALNKRNMTLLRELISDSYPGFEGTKGPEGFEKAILGLIKACPDIQWNIEDIFGNNNEVAIRWKWQGTFTGPFSVYTPTGKTITNDGMAIFTVKEGKIVDSKLQTDRLGFLQEINVIPANPATLLAKPAPKDAISLIDKFLIPVAGKTEFYERMRENQKLLKTLPGLIQQDAYEYTDKDGNLICVTIAQWESHEAINKAKEAVQAEYKRSGFDMPAMLKRLNITIDRGLYTEVKE